MQAKGNGVLWDEGCWQLNRMDREDLTKKGIFE